jgi:hypothetical protein
MESSSSAGQAKSAMNRHVLFCFLPHALFVMLALGLWGGGWWLLLPILFLQVALPLLDWITGWQDDGHFEKFDFSAGQLALLHWNTRLYALFYMASVVYLAMSLNRFNAMEIGILIASASLMGGIGFGAAHELLHGKEDLDQIVQRLLTTFLFYPHYKLIHIRSHHVHAGTDHDENTAWLNESIYSYIFRTIPGSMIRCWNMEARRCSGDGLLKNKMFIYALGQAALMLGLYLVSGLNGTLFYLAHILGAHIVLESVNYIQHYGLMRRMNNGEYEKTGAEHSWDTYHFFSSYITFRVGHHSYHHLAVKPYYLLTPEPQAPKLPVGYFWAIAMVLLPPWWRHVINPKVNAPAVPGA